MIALEVVTFVVYDNVSDLTYHYFVNSGCPGLRKVNWYFFFVGLMGWQCLILDSKLILLQLMLNFHYKGDG